MFDSWDSWEGRAHEGLQFAYVNSEELDEDAYALGMQQGAMKGIKTRLKKDELFF